MKSLLDRFAKISPGLYFKALQARSALTLAASHRVMSDYLASTAHARLQLGSGRNVLPGWLNTDYLGKPPVFPHLDVTRRFPLPDNAFERIYSEHMIEHITQRDGETMLAECFRVLKPGGRIRIETPDLQRICALFTTHNQPDQRAYIEWHQQDFGIPGYPPTICFAINDALRNWDHLFVYDEEMLRLAMEKAGFVNLRRYDWNVTDDDSFRNISKRTAYPFSLFESLVIEAEKR